VIVVRETLAFDAIVDGNRGADGHRENTDENSYIKWRFIIKMICIGGKVVLKTSGTQVRGAE